MNQKATKDTLQTKIELANKDGNQMKKKGESAIDESNCYFSHRAYDVLGKEIKERLKAKNHGRHYNDEDVDMCYRIQLTSKEF